MNYGNSIPQDVINKSYSDGKISEMIGHKLYLKKDEFKLRSDKESVKEVFFRRAVKSTIRIFYDIGAFDSYNNADGIEDCFFLTRRHRGSPGST